MSNPIAGISYAWVEAASHWFYRENLAATIHYRLGHLSNANIKGPNIGLNANVLLLGVTWFL